MTWNDLEMFGFVLGYQLHTFWHTMESCTVVVVSSSVLVTVQRSRTLVLMAYYAHALCPVLCTHIDFGCCPPWFTPGSSYYLWLFLGCNQYWAGWVYGFCGFYVWEHPKAPPAVVLVLKHFRRRGHGFRSHPTDWESLESNTKLGKLLDLSTTPASFLLKSGALGFAQSQDFFKYFLSAKSTSPVSKTDQ